MKVGGWFSGVGGFELAAERAGMEVAFHSEIDRYASAVLEHHWPDVPNLGDVRHVTDEPNADVWTGGFPCQDYSVAGNREGLAGDRGALWWSWLDRIGARRPTWVVGENVPGLLSSRGGADFATIVDSLVELGYGVAWGVLDAQYFGVAQRRRRVFIVGHSGGEPRPEVLALSEGLFGHPAPSRETGKATSALTACSLGGGGGVDENTAQAGFLTTAFRQERSDKYTEDETAGTLAARDFKDATDLVAFHATQEPIHGHVAPRLGANGSVGVAFAQNQRDELRDLNGVAGALASQPGMKQQTYITTPQVRRLTPLECERLQGFPDRWTDVAGMSDSQRYRQMGNAVAVPVVEWIMRRIAIMDGGGDV